MPEGRRIESRYIGLPLRGILEHNLQREETARNTDGHSSHEQIRIFENLRWRMTIVLRMVTSLYLSRESSYFDEIWRDIYILIHRMVTW